MRVLWAYSIKGRNLDQEAGCRVVMHWRAAPRTCLACSIWPFVCGWQVEDNLAAAPREEQNDYHTQDANWGPHSYTMSIGIRWSLETWVTNRRGDHWLRSRFMTMVTLAGNRGSRPVNLGNLGVVKLEPRKTKHDRQIGGSDNKKFNLFAMITGNY